MPRAMFVPIVVLGLCPATLLQGQEETLSPPGPDPLQ